MDESKQAATPSEKPVSEQTLEEVVATYDRMLNVLTHPDWRDVYLYLNDRARAFESEMVDAGNWDLFIVARALARYTRGVLMKLPEIIKHEKEEFEREIEARKADAPLPEDELGPPEYEE